MSKFYVMNDNLKEFLENAGFFLLFLVYIWGGCWLINGFIWIAGLGLDMWSFFQHIASEGNWFMKILSYQLGLQFMYYVGFFGLLNTIYSPYDDMGNNHGYTRVDKWSLGLGIALTLFIIVVYDPRIAHIMPALIERPIAFLQNDLYFRLIGGADLYSKDISGDISDPFYFTVFDIAMTFVCAFWVYGSVSDAKANARKYVR